TPSKNDLYISKLQLYNAINNTFIRDLKNGDKIDTEQLGINNFNIRAVPNSLSYNERGLSSVRFSLDANANFSTINHPNSNGGEAYFMFVRRQGIAWNPSDGEYIISATPYYDRNPSTEAGITNQIVVYVNVDPPVILPVEFLEVSVERTGDQVTVNW